MKRRFFPLLLAAGLLLSTTALAANDSMENFVPVRTYEGQFSDLTEDSVFYDNVSALYAYGLSNGRPDGTYGLQAPITRGELFIFAGRIRSLYRTGDPEAGPGGFGSEESPLSAKYLGYLKSERVVGNEVSSLFGELSQPATRAQAAHVLAHVLPPEEMPLINKEIVDRGYASGKFLTDVTGTTLYQEDILLLYQAGISTGSDDTGAFHPNDSITRGAAAAMLTRLVDPGLRKTLNWEVPAQSPVEEPEQTPARDPAEEPEQTPADSSTGKPSASTVDRPSSYAALVEPGTYIAAPATGAEMDQVIRYMISQDTNQLTLNYGPLPVAKARTVMDAALRIAKVYCEQSYNSVNCSFREENAMVLTFTAGGAGTEKTNEYRQAALDAARKVLEQLRAEGALREDMTELEKAEVCYRWICENCAYDDTAGANSLGHIPYSLFYLGSAVCDGYTGAYNLLLKLEGITCMALSNENHIWTVAELDGNLVHIDTTWGDTAGSKPDYRFFAMTPEQSWGQHKW